jgi:hypothetical protein
MVFHAGTAIYHVRALPIESELARPGYLTFDGTKAFNIFGFVLRLSHLGPD